MTTKAKSKNKDMKSKLPIKTFTPEITVGAAKKIGASSATLEELISELIDNTITKEKPKEPKLVEARLVYRSDNKSFVRILDNSIGIPPEEIENIFNYGESGNVGKLLLSKMGMGMKVAIAGLGQLKRIITKTEGNPPYIITCNHNPDEKLVYSYNVYDGDDFPNAYASGTIIEIENSDMVRKWTHNNWLKFCSNIESTYPGLLNKYININTTYICGNDNWKKDLKGYNPLMSHPKNIIIGADIDPWLGLGENKPIIDKLLLKVPNHPDVIAHLTAWHKPSPAQVQDYHNSLKDDDPNKEIYDSDDYENSPWFWGKAHGGISLMYNDKVLQHDIQSGWTERNERHGIILDIKEGIDFTALKSGVKRTSKWAAILKEIKRILKENDFDVRALSGLPAVSEDVYLNNFIQQIKTDPLYRSALGIKNDTQILVQPRKSFGKPDALILTPDQQSVAWVVEAKKDRAGGEEARQLLGYMVSCKCSQGIFISPKKKEASFLQVEKDFNEWMYPPLKIEFGKMDVTQINALTLTHHYFVA